MYPSPANTDTKCPRTPIPQPAVTSQNHGYVPGPLVVYRISTRKALTAA